MKQKQDRSVVRVAEYAKDAIGLRERHNERLNGEYANESVRLSQSHLNVHFKQCDGTYSKALDRMVANGTVNRRGLRQDATVWNEFVMDVNTEYFEQHGGYEYARQFFEDAFHFAEKEMGADNIISAVMHADELNEGLTLQLGREVYHYHLHVIALPVVDKEILYSKRCKDKELVGTIKEIIHQVSHSKKWAFLPAMNEDGTPKLNKNGKQIFLPSYSPLQDRFFSYMRDCGYEGFERGIKGSTAEHLTDAEFKTKQELLTYAMLQDLNEDLRLQGSWLQQTVDELTPIKAELEDIDSIGEKASFGKVKLSVEDCGRLKNLAKEGVLARETIAMQKAEIQRLNIAFNKLRDMYDTLKEKCEPYLQAIQQSPGKVKEFLTGLLRPKEKPKVEPSPWDREMPNYKPKTKKKEDFER